MPMYCTSIINVHTYVCIISRKSLDEKKELSIMHEPVGMRTVAMHNEVKPFLKYLWYSLKWRIHLNDLFDSNIMLCFIILKMKAHFENESTSWKWEDILKMKADFENKSTFRKWKHVLKIKAHSENESTFQDLYFRNNHIP